MGNIEHNIIINAEDIKAFIQVSMVKSTQGLPSPQDREVMQSMIRGQIVLCELFGIISKGEIKF